MSILMKLIFHPIVYVLSPDGTGPAGRAILSFLINTSDQVPGSQAQTLHHVLSHY